MYSQDQRNRYSQESAWDMLYRDLVNAFPAWRPIGLYRTPAQ
jgi:hypothetical protein